MTSVEVTTSTSNENLNETIVTSGQGSRSPSPKAPVRKNRMKSADNSATDSQVIVINSSDNVIKVSDDPNKNTILNNGDSVPKNYVQMIVVKYEVQSKDEKHSDEAKKSIVEVPAEKQNESPTANLVQNKECNLTIDVSQSKVTNQIEKDANKVENKVEMENKDRIKSKEEIKKSIVEVPAEKHNLNESSKANLVQNKECNLITDVSQPKVSNQIEKDANKVEKQLEKGNKDRTKSKEETNKTEIPTTNAKSEITNANKLQTQQISKEKNAGQKGKQETKIPTKEKSSIPLLHSKSEQSNIGKPRSSHSLSRAESEVSLSRRTRTPIEQLQQDNAALKKTLEGERSAFREQRAAMEAEGRRERAEAKRREANLETQLRMALKASGSNQTPGLPAMESNTGDAVRLSIALQTAKAENKALQEKLQMAVEADKRKVTELRAQHDAHNLQIQQMEKDARAQTVKLLEELKSKERQLDLARKGSRTSLNKGGSSSTTTSPKSSRKMAVAEQLLVMEGQITRLEHELQRRDDIIHSLRAAKSRREKQMSAHRMSKENLLKDIFLDVDSAISSAPTSLSPQPSPDLWTRSQESNHRENEDGLIIEAARKQIQELEKALSLSTENQRSALLKAAQLEEQLQDLREHADLLEFRCLELEDSNEKRKSVEVMTDSDSGCTSPEDRLKNSVSPQLRRSDSGYKSPTQRSRSPTIKNQRILKTPTNESIDFMDGYCGKNFGDIDTLLGDGYHKTDDIRNRLEGMLLRSTCKEDKQCLEKVLHLMWSLQALNNSFSDNELAMVRTRRNLDDFRSEFEQNKSSKIIATVSPYTQTSLHKNIDFVKSNSIDINYSPNDDSKKIFYGLQESGIFEDTDWSSKETQTEWWDCVCTEPESDLALEVQRLNQIREQLEKSGAIKNNTLTNRKVNQYIEKPQLEVNEKYVDFYEKRIKFLENKISIYESSDDVKEKKLAQRLQREIELQTKVKNLEDDFKRLNKKYKQLEEECCEYEEAENDIRLHCQELEAEFDLLTAKLREIDEQRICAKTEVDYYRSLVQEYEEKLRMQFEIENEFSDRIVCLQKWFSVASIWTIWKFVHMHKELNKKQENNLALVEYRSHTRNEIENSELKMKIKALEDQIAEKDNQLMKITEDCNMHIKKLDEASRNVKTVEIKSMDENKDTCEYAKQIASLLENEKLLKAEIAKMEMREVAFLETLATGDTMWNDMEQKYKQKITELEERESELLEVISQFENEKLKWKESNEPWKTKVRESEEMEVILESKIEKLKSESRNLYVQNQTLQDKTQNLQNEISKQKSDFQNREDELLREITKMKKNFRETQNELSEYNKFHSEIIKTHDSEVAKLKKELKKLSKEIMELEVTNGELKEEVYTLETQAKDNISAIDVLRREYEQKISAIMDELQTKTKEVTVLEKTMLEKHCFPSALEELNDSNKNNEHNSCLCKLLCNSVQSENLKSLKMLKPYDIDLLITNLNSLKRKNKTKPNANERNNNQNKPDESTRPKIKEKPFLLIQNTKVDKNVRNDEVLDKYCEQLTKKLLMYFDKTNIECAKETKMMNIRNNNYFAVLDHNRNKQELICQINNSVKNIIHTFINENIKNGSNRNCLSRSDIQNNNSKHNDIETESHNISAKDLIATFNKNVQHKADFPDENKSKIDYLPPKGLVFDRVSKLSQEFLKPQITLKRSVSLIECKPITSKDISDL